MKTGFFFVPFLRIADKLQAKMMMSPQTFPVE